MLKVPFPACGIVAIAELMHARPVEHLLDAAPDARAGLRCLVPNRRQKLDNHRRVDCGDVQITESVAGTQERFFPLPLMLRVTEARQVLGKVLPHAHAERHLAGLFVEIGLALCRLGRRCDAQSGPRQT